MRFEFAGFAIACGLLSGTCPASAEIIEVNPATTAQVTIIRGAPDRCGLTGPAVIHVREARQVKAVRCARPAASDAGSRAKASNLVIVILDDRHKRHYKHAH